MGIIEKVRADAMANQVAMTDSKVEAIEIADAYMNNVGLPLYTDLMKALGMLQAAPNDPRQHRAALDLLVKAGAA